MYTPLRFVEQVQSMLNVPSNPSMAQIANERHNAYIKELVQHDYDKQFVEFISVWRDSDNVKFTKEFVKDYTDKTGLAIVDNTDFAFTCGVGMLVQRWSRAKRVYKIEETMLGTFINMTLPNIVNQDVLLKLPSDCFYIDYGKEEFVEGATGCFVQRCTYNDMCYFRFLHLVEHEKIICVISDTKFLISGPEYTLDTSVNDFVKRRRLPLEDGTSVLYSERKFIKFFTNFVLYLHAVNNDVEYTERTKQAYKKPNPNAEPKNKIREVEEFGVGFRYASTVSKSKPKVRYVGDTTTEDGPKRSVTSHYRQAHWHHYWTKNKITGEKELILKWLEEMFVRGNVDFNGVVVHDVKE